MNQDELKQRAEDALLKHGYHPTILFVETETGLFPMQIIGEPNPMNMRSAGVVVAQLLERSLELKAVSVIHEGWMVIRDKADVAKYGKPKAVDSADRSKVLVVASWNVCLELGEAAISEIKKAGKHVDLLECDLSANLDAGYYDNLKAFVRGFRGEQ